MTGVFLGKLRVTQLFKTFSAAYRTCKFIRVYRSPPMICLRGMCTETRMFSILNLSGKYIFTTWFNKKKLSILLTRCIYVSSVTLTTRNDIFLHHSIIGLSIGSIIRSLRGTKSRHVLLFKGSDN
jgi:hypothetical protein